MEKSSLSINRGDLHDLDNCRTKILFLSSEQLKEYNKKVITNIHNSNLNILGNCHMRIQRH